MEVYGLKRMDIPGVDWSVISAYMVLHVPVHVCKFTTLASQFRSKKWVPRQWSFENYEASLGSSPEGPLSLTQIANWLVDTALFEQAWAAACAGPFNWWWSEQLCLFTAGAWTVFIISEGEPRVPFGVSGALKAVQGGAVRSSTSGRTCYLGNWSPYRLP
ncbi:hypothetical protein OE88DRAFT_1665003 [Heliocybe sulcata]|uniref:Uncharacterized protein n=1 Tax=Heliocybe sulcata TaxID=5364 RepID=A0A5C3MRD2_9AGAM|nr:hypothetical protein OE88DRAFT_1665003 [Heliocybe sulcata]